MTTINDYYFKLCEVLEGFHLHRPNTLQRDIDRLTDDDCEQLSEEWRGVYKGLDPKKFWTRDDQQDVLRYFPSSPFQNVIRKKAINRFLLYTDKVVLYDPLTSLLMWKHSKKGVEGLLFREIPRLLSFKPVFKAGIGELVPQRNLMTTYLSSTVIGQEIDTDLKDVEFKKICYNNLVVGRTDTDVQASIFDGQLMSHTETIKLDPKGPREVSIPIPLHIGEKLVIPPKPDVGDYKIADGLVRHKAAEINFDLLTAQDLKANLISNSEMVFQLLDRKSRRKSKLMENVDTKFIPALLSLDLPVLDKASTTKVVTLRQHLNDEFLDFKRDVREAFKSIESTPYSERFVKEVQEIKEDNIDPALRALNRDVNRIKKHRIMRSLGSAIFTTTPLIGSLLINDPYNILAWASTVPAKMTWDEVVELWNELESKKGNSWYFLWKLS